MSPLLRLAWFACSASLAGGCSGPDQAVVPDGAVPHLGEDWFAYRASTLGIDVPAARARDAALSEDEPPPVEVYDRALTVEAAVLWRGLCASCHGLNGDLEGVPNMSPEPKRWDTVGVSMGFFFGGDGMRAGIYRRIQRGGSADGTPSAMPSWKGILSREQIWGLVRHIEGF